jgi:hypothetical protein
MEKPMRIILPAAALAIAGVLAATIAVLAAGTTGSPLSQAALLNEFQTCAAQGLGAGCITVARTQDIILSAVPPGGAGAAPFAAASLILKSYGGDL